MRDPKSEIQRVEGERRLVHHLLGLILGGPLVAYIAGYNVHLHNPGSTGLIVGGGAIGYICGWGLCYAVLRFASCRIDKKVEREEAEYSRYLGF